MIATDPLSLVFLGCFLFAGTILVVTTLLGVGHGHELHLGHLGHDLGHFGHGHASIHAGDAGHAGHAGHAHVAANGHDAAHAAHGHGDAGTGASAGASAWDAFRATLLGGLNFYSILTLILIFGLLGYLLHNFTDLGVTLTLILALALGVACALAVGALITRLVISLQSTTLTRESSQLEGRLGAVSMAIREGGIGEVIFTSARGARQSVGARSRDGMPIPADTEVVILSYADGIASVQPWDRFMASVRAGDAPMLEALEPIEGQS